MDPGFLWVGFLYFSEKTNGRVCIEHFIFLDENFVTNYINDARSLFALVRYWQESLSSRLFGSIHRRVGRYVWDELRP